jgi:hypothetical protein
MPSSSSAIGTFLPLGVLAVKTSIIACSISRAWSQDLQQNLRRYVVVPCAAQNLAERIIAES